MQGYQNNNPHATRDAEAASSRCSLTRSERCLKGTVQHKATGFAFPQPSSGMGKGNFIDKRGKTNLERTKEVDIKQQKIAHQYKDRAQEQPANGGPVL